MSSLKGYVNCVVLVTIAVAVGQVWTDNRPMIGVLTQECWSSVCKGNAYLPASYVKYLESAGARVVPVHINRDKAYYQKIVDVTNGLLIPGGGQDLFDSGYAKAAQHIWNITYGGNDTTYPIWGTCLGFEQLAVLVDPKLTLVNCSASDLANTLKMNGDQKNSRLFKGSNDVYDVRDVISQWNHINYSYGHNSYGILGVMKNGVVKIVQKEAVTYNHHRKCVQIHNTTKTYEDFFSILSTSIDKDGLEYVSTVEAKSVPVFGVQWHPEKNAFEFVLNNVTSKVPHSANAVRIGQYMANFLVNVARDRKRTGLPLNEESDLLIYNYQSVYTGTHRNYEFEQIYVFNGSKSNNWFVSSITSSICLILIVFNVVFQW